MELGRSAIARSRGHSLAVTICGIALPKVMMILYSPFHDFIRRSIRITRSMRNLAQGVCTYHGDRAA